MKNLAIIIGKIIRKIMKLTGGGSSYPGKLALQICPNLLEKLEWPDRVVFVTGTNGKTSTTHYLAQIFQSDNQQVMTNAQGANLIQGIATIALENSRLSGKIKSDIAILEIDEGSFPKISKQIHPSHLVITNLFPDQIDRFGSPDEVLKLISQNISKDTTLVLNGLDPRLAMLGSNHVNNAVVYYAVQPTDFKQPTQSINCPNCGEPLNYTFPIYEQIGYFDCQNCSLKTPAIDYLAENVSLKEQTFSVNDNEYTIPQSNIYTLFNAMAAVSTATTMGVKTSAIQNALASRLYVKGRNDQINIGNKHIPINLAKNPASMNQTLVSMLSDAQSPFNVMFAINNAPADGTDTSWLNYVDFSLLKEKGVVSIYLTGTAADDVKANLIEGGITGEIISLKSHKEALHYLQNSDADSYIIANYTALYEIYEEI